MVFVYIVAVVIGGWLIKIGMQTYEKRERYRSEQYMMEHSQRMKQDLLQDNAVTRELSETIAVLAEQTKSMRLENSELKDRVRNLEKLITESDSFPDTLPEQDTPSQAHED